MAWTMALLPAAMLVLGFPIYLILITTAVVVFAFFSAIPPMAIHTVMFGSMSSSILVAVPFFLFAGEVMARGDISSRLLNWVAVVMGRTRGSLPLTTMGASTIFGAISGATTATVASIGSLAYQPLLDQGYGRRFSSGLIVASGSLSNIIPPSIPLILYGFVSQTSVVDLFAAGITPGILLAVIFGLYIYVRARRSASVPVGEAITWARFAQSSRRAILAFGAPAIVLGGIYGGIFSPTEAAGVACVYALAVAMLAYRAFGVQEMFAIATRSMYITAQLFTIVAAASVYSWLLITGGVGNVLSDFINAVDLPPWIILLIINALLLVVGLFIDTGSAILILTPILMPIADALGVDPVHFGIIVVFNLSIGTFTPPFGLNIFVGQAIFKIPVQEIYRGIMPFIALSVAALMIITFVPPVTIWILPFVQ